MNPLQQIANYVNPVLQTAGGILNLRNLVQGGGQGGGGFNVGPFQIPREVLGAGLIGLGSAMDREPGYAVEARQSLRNLFTSPQFGPGATNYISSLYSDPTAIARGMSGQVGALQQYYEPLLQQQEKALLDQVQQRAIAGLPASLSPSMGGGELSAIRSAVQNQLLPARQALLGDLARENLTRQYSAASQLFGAGNEAAGRILSYAEQQNNPLATALAQLGAAQLAGGVGGGAGGGGFGALGGQGGATGGQGGVGGGLQMLGQLMGQPGGIGQALRQNPGLVQQLGAALGTQLSFDAAQAGAGLSGWQAMTSRGVAVPIEAISTGAAGAAGATDFGLAGPGLLGPAGIGSLGQIASGVGAGAAGYFVGRGVGTALGKATDSQSVGALSGAASGATTGFALSGPIGAVVGGISGLVGGLGGTRGYQHAVKAQRLAADLSAQHSNVQNIGSFWLNALGAAGYDDIEGFGNFIDQEIAGGAGSARGVSYGGLSGTYDQPDSIVTFGSQLLLRQLQQANPQITDLDQVPNFRQGYIDHLRNTYQIEQGGSAVRTQDIDKFGGYLDLAGISRY